jgi:hypothetical protein
MAAPLTPKLSGAALRRPQPRCWAVFLAYRREMAAPGHGHWNSTRHPAPATETTSSPCPRPERLTVRLKTLVRGTYRIRFRALSVDSHVVESEFPFALRP